VISPPQRPLPDKTQHSQQTNIHAPGGTRTHDRSSRDDDDDDDNDNDDNNNNNNNCCSYSAFVVYGASMSSSCVGKRITEPTQELDKEAP